MDQPAPPRTRKEPREVELKFELDPGAVAPVEAALARLSARRPKRERLRSTYFDTPRYALREAGITLRVRRIGRRRIQTVKLIGGAAGLFNRPEWEGKIEGDTPDWDLARTTGLAPLARDGVAKAARGVFSVAVERRRFHLGVGESRIEAALDVGVVEAGKRSAPIRELELELKRGRLADLFGLAKTIAETAPLRLGLRTKAEQGFAAARGRPARPVKAMPSPIVEGMSVADGFQAVARSCLAHLLANEALFREARDPEAVHQMRVALRRLRAALSLFRDAVADDEIAAVKTGLRELAAALGEARDLDVFIRKTLAPARARDPGDAALAALARSYAERREAAYDAALETVASGRLGRIVLDTLAWIEAGPWLRKDGKAEREAPVERFAADELRRRAKRIRKRGRHLPELAPDERHRVRIAVKKLRYAAEFFAPLYEGKGRAKRTRRFRDALGELQDRLGDLNDIAVAATMAETAGDGAAPAARLLAAEQEAHFDEHLAAAAKAYKAFGESEKFWR